MIARSSATDFNGLDTVADCNAQNNRLDFSDCEMNTMAPLA